MTGNERKNVCPLLKNPEHYNPDTVDLVTNAEERNYWLPCLEQMVKKFVGKAQPLNPDDPKATEKAEICFKQFHSLIEQVTEDPSIMKPLSIRTLLNFNEDNLRANKLEDAWLLQKKTESYQALKELKNRIDHIDSLDDFYEKWLEIIQGVLAGNVFDWPERIFFFKWVDHFQKKPYKTCVIFVDNSGVDFILGILPLTRELLSHGTKVVLTANTYPALNDVTFQELNLYCCQAAEHCEILKDSIKNGQLITMENGQKGPCLDLRDLSEGLCDVMKSADLVIIEGMGRAVHTNLYAKLTVDCFKLAVLKNEWLARSLGARQFSVICDFEPAS
nr:pantothenate kinase 4 [Leptinotarsa decemlineata]